MQTQLPELAVLVKLLPPTQMGPDLFKSLNGLRFTMSTAQFADI